MWGAGVGGSRLDPGFSPGHVHKRSSQVFTFVSPLSGKLSGGLKVRLANQRRMIIFLLFMISHDYNILNPDEYVYIPADDMIWLVSFDHTHYSQLK
jgi:hypothetical protein